MRTPFSTVQCDSFSFAFLTASSYCSLLILAFLLIGTRPCQFVKSLPLKRAVKPGGGTLSFFSPALVQVVSTRVKPVSANHRRIVGSFRGGGMNFVVGIILRRAGANCKAKSAK